MKSQKWSILWGKFVENDESVRKVSLDGEAYHTNLNLKGDKMASGFFVLAKLNGGRRCYSIVDRSEAKRERKRHRQIVVV